MGEAGEGPRESGDFGGDEEGREGSTRPWRWHSEPGQVAAGGCGW